MEWTKDRTDTVSTMFYAGKSDAEIALELETTADVVREYRHKLGLRIASFPQHKQWRIQGLTQCYICKQLFPSAEIGTSRQCKDCKRKYTQERNAQKKAQKVKTPTPQYPTSYPVLSELIPMSEEIYIKLKQFKALGGEYTIEPSFANNSIGGSTLVHVVIALNYHDHKVSEVTGKTADQAVFAAFDQLRYVLPESEYEKFN